MTTTCRQCKHTALNWVKNANIVVNMRVFVVSLWNDLEMTKKWLKTTQFLELMSSSVQGPWSSVKCITIDETRKISIFCRKKPLLSSKATNQKDWINAFCKLFAKLLNLERYKRIYWWVINRSIQNNYSQHK